MLLHYMFMIRVSDIYINRQFPLCSYLVDQVSPYSHIRLLRTDIRAYVRYYCVVWRYE